MQHGLRKVRDEVVSVATSRTRIMRSRGDRVRAHVENKGANRVIFLNHLDVEVGGLGYTLYAGDKAIIKPETDGDDVVDEWFAISDGAAADLFIREWVAEKNPKVPNNA